MTFEKILALFVYNIDGKIVQGTQSNTYKTSMLCFRDKDIP